MKRQIIHDLRMAKIVMIVAITWLSISLAIAAPPSNDNFDNATVVTTPLPFIDTINTVEAITAPDDPNCMGQGPTVWYSFTPTEDIRIQARTFESDYDTTLSVYTGTPGNLSQIACNDDAGSLQSSITFNAVAGQTYFFMVGAFASGVGGNLVLTVDVAPPPLTMDLNIDPVGTFNRQGPVTIHGTVTCSTPTSIEINGDVKQYVGRVFIQGFFGTIVQCNGINTPWTVTTTAQNGQFSFSGGQAKVSANSFAYDTVTQQTIQDSAAAKVRLRSSK